MNNSHSTRPARADDLPAITKLIHDCGLFPPDEAQTVVDMARQHFDTPEPGHHWWITADDQGAAYLAPELPEGVFNLLFLAVAPGARRQGRGAALLAEVEAQMRGAEARLLIIDTSATPAMAPARALYDRFGYQRAGVIPDYWAPGDDKVIFVKPL